MRLKYSFKLMLYNINYPFFVFLQEFDNDYTEFKAKVLDLETQIATKICLAFKDCSGLESAFKVTLSISCNKINLLWTISKNKNTMFR